MATTLVLHYAACATCRKARAWLKAHDVALHERPIVDEPPTKAELAKWIPASGLPVRKWLNVSGQSYRAIGRDRIAAMTDAQLIDAMSKDGKLVKRPLVVAGSHVLVGFDPQTYAATLGKKHKKGT